MDADFFRRLIGVDRLTSTGLISEKVGVEINHTTLDRMWNDAMSLRMREGVPLRPGVHAFLDAIDKLGLPRAIATNSLTQRAVAKLSSAGLLSGVNAVVGVDQVDAGKPAPDVYLEAASQLGVSPADCVGIDDSDLGIRAAIAAGLGTVIQVRDLVESYERLAHHQVSSLNEALLLLGM